MSAPMTGRKVLAIFALGFGTIITANLTLAFNAVHSFPGVEVKNSYIASQTFDADRARQEALGWTAHAQQSFEGLRITLTDDKGQPVRAGAIRVTVGRPTTNAVDRTDEPVWDGTGYVTAMPDGAGLWQVRIVAEAEDGTPFRTRTTLFAGDAR